MVVAIFAAVAWYAMRSIQKQKNNVTVEQVSRVEPELDNSDAFSAALQQEMTHTIDAEESASVSEQAKQVKKNTASAAQTEIAFKNNEDIDLDIEVTSEPEPSVNDVNDGGTVIAFTIMAGVDQHFSGEDVKFVLEIARFQHGDMSIFHRLTPQNKIVFSAANILAPGTFDVDNVSSMTTPGILVFAKLPGPINVPSLFDELLATSRTLSDKLNGTLCDESRKPITEESIEAMRSRILSLNLSMHSEN